MYATIIILINSTWLVFMWQHLHYFVTYYYSTWDPIWTHYNWPTRELACRSRRLFGSTASIVYERQTHTHTRPRSNTANRKYDVCSPAPSVFYFRMGVYTHTRRWYVMSACVCGPLVFHQSNIQTVPIDICKFTSLWESVNLFCHCYWDWLLLRLVACDQRTFGEFCLRYSDSCV